jgi:hypothetical protein
LSDRTGPHCGFTSFAQLFECQELERLHGKCNSLWDAAEATGLEVVLMARIDLIFVLGFVAAVTASYSTRVLCVYNLVPRWPVVHRIRHQHYLKALRASGHGSSA